MNDQEVSILRQSSGSDPKLKRNSGLFSFLRWFKSSSRESVSSDVQNSASGSNESLNSTGTAASFSYVTPTAYVKSKASDGKCIVPGPETDTYKARLKQRDKIRERDKDITLRKKYNLFFHRDTLKGKVEEEDNSKSLPLMTRKMEEEERGHRRTNSDSSKTKKAGAYLHVKGKRKAPQPPKAQDGTLSLRRKKRLAPQPPMVTSDKVAASLDNGEVIYNDSLKLDHGILKPAVEAVNRVKSGKASVGEAPVSPRPWYKRNSVGLKKDHKYEPVEAAQEEKRKSGMMFLTNISELDREASELIRKEQRRNEDDLSEMPEFMRPKTEGPNTDSLMSPKRKSAKDLIAKFNAITNVTKVTVNSAFFGNGAPPKRDYFGPNDKKKRGPENKQFVPLQKSETTACVAKPKIEKKPWYCPKCGLENDYWRIICHVCSTIKPYFDDLTAPPGGEKSASEITATKQTVDDSKNTRRETTNLLERSRTQIGFTALAAGKDREDKREERERLKKMLIEMKNSLPKRRSRDLSAATQRKSTIDENPELDNPNLNKTVDDKLKEIDEKDVLKESEVRQIKPSPVQKSFQLMRPKDFEDIYGEKSGKSPVTHMYANLAQNEHLFLNVPKALNDMKGNVSGGNNADTLEINRLLRRLETAIAKGDLSDAAGFARELAQLKVNCSVIRQKPAEVRDVPNGYMIEMYVEDRLSHRGPFPLQVTEDQTVAELKKQVEREFEIPTAVQRWILGKNLATNDDATLKEHKVTKNGCPAFLYLVAPSAPTNNEKANVLDNKDQPKFETKEINIAPNLDKNSDRKELPKSEIKEINIPSTSGVAIKTAAENKVKPNNFPAETKQVAIIKDVNFAPTLSDNKCTALKTEVIVPLISQTVVQSKASTNKQDVKPNAGINKSENVPKIVAEQFKTADSAPSSSNGMKEEKQPPIAVEEDFSEYDKTLKPKNLTWECKYCTLLNPYSTNICLVCSLTRQAKDSPQPARKNEPKHYLELMKLDSSDIVPNSEPFECLICLTEIPANEGVTLRECLHQFCKACLAHTVEFSDEAEVKCPYRDEQYSCDIALQDREIKALVTSTVYDQFLAKSVSQAENKIDKSFHCKTPDCIGWCIFEDNVNEFWCPVCRKTNCLTCQAIHTGLNCKQYQERMNAQSETNEDAKRTREMLEEMVNKGEALTCPACRVILMKKWGCDWVRCSMCKTEICWVTRGLRWGPAGKGDTSGGCKCGLNGIKCHPQCNYCH